MDIARKAARTAAALALAGLAASGCGVGQHVTGGPATRNTATPQAAPPPPDGAALQASYERVIKTALPSIVQITTNGSLGSGVVFDKTGHILTNAHVVGDSPELRVTPATGGTPRKARVIDTFPAGDLAVIKVDDARGMPPASFGRSADLRVGQIVLAMGNPLGFSGSVTQGIVSALGRTVSGESHGDRPASTIINAIQTSAPINPGNSGGALVDLSGKVIGIPTLAAVDPKLGTAPGIGFAIPSDTATDVANQIIKYGKVVNTRRAALGVGAGTAVDAEGNPIGALVGSVTPGGAADRAGIAPGDVIREINDRPTPSAHALSQLLATLKPGDRVSVRLLRPDGSTATVTVTLGELPTTD